jgi:hypothetical protein
MDKEYQRRKRAIAAARRDALAVWVIAGLAAAACAAWVALFMIWE